MPVPLEDSQLFPRCLALRLGWPCACSMVRKPAGISKSFASGSPRFISLTVMLRADARVLALLDQVDSQLR